MLTEMEPNWIIFTPSMVLSKIFDWFNYGIATWNSQEKIKLAIPHEQNYTAWWKTVFSELTQDISLSVSDKQAIMWASTCPAFWLLFSWNILYFLLRPHV